MGLAENPVEYPDHLHSTRAPFTGTPMEEFKSVSEDEVGKVIGASPSSSCRLDPLPIWMLKKCLSTLLPITTLIVNLSQVQRILQLIEACVCHTLLKKAYLDPDIFKNFRPVSNLSFISKLIERI